MSIIRLKSRCCIVPLIEGLGRRHLAMPLVILSLIKYRSEMVSQMSCDSKRQPGKDRCLWKALGLKIDCRMGEISLAH